MASKQRFVIVIGLSLLLAGAIGQASAQSSTGQPASGQAPPEMSLIPEGQFWMGRTFAYQFDQLNWVARARLDDQPARPISLDAFYLDKYEVTNTDYAKFVEATGHPAPWSWMAGKTNPGEERWPVFNVNWDDSNAYCKWAGKRLPTEAEWEKAARGGLDRRLYPWGDTLEPEAQGEAAGQAPPAKRSYGFGSVTEAKKNTVMMARYNAANGPGNVGSFPPNGYGLYDMTGNVWEWVSDWYGRDYYPVAPRDNPKGPDAGKYRVLRGGGWGTPVGNGGGVGNLLGVYFRTYGPGDQKSVVVGFRCAKDAPQKP